MSACVCACVQNAKTEAISEEIAYKVFAWIQRLKSHILYTSVMENELSMWMCVLQNPFKPHECLCVFVRACVRACVQNAKAEAISEEIAYKVFKSLYLKVFAELQGLKSHVLIYFCHGEQIICMDVCVAKSFLTP